MGKVYASIVESLDEYVLTKVEKWSHDVEASSQTKLKLPLLRRDPRTNTLEVNFDADLVCLLREVKYFLLLKLPVPESAIQIFKKAEVFRTQTGNLELIVNMYNNMVQALLPVERPLVETYIAKIDRTVSRGLKQLSWKSHGVDLFITECMSDVKSAKTILDTLKRNLDKIEEHMVQWRKDPLIERPMKPSRPNEFNAAHKSRLHRVYKMIKEHGSHIHRLLKDSNKVLKVSQGLPDWKAYVDFVNNIVVDGLSRVVHVSMEKLLSLVDAENIRKKESLRFLK